MLNLETLKRLAEHKEKFPGVDNVTLPLELVDEMAQKLIGLECVRRLNVVIKKRQADRIAELEAAPNDGQFDQDEIARLYNEKSALEARVKELEQVAHKCAVKGLQDAAELDRRKAQRTVTLPQRWNVSAAVPFNEKEARGIMLPAEGGRWVSVLDMEHLLHRLGVKVKP